MMIKLWWHRLATKRVNFGIFAYGEADDMINKGWELAKEEDDNHNFGSVYLEQRVERRALYVGIR